MSMADLDERQERRSRKRSGYRATTGIWTLSPATISSGAFVIAGFAMDSLLLHHEDVVLPQFSERGGFPLVSMFLYVLAILVGLWRCFRPAAKGIKRRRLNGSLVSIVASVTLVAFDWWFQGALVAACASFVLDVSSARRTDAEG